MGVIAEAVRHMLAAGMTADAVIDAVAAMEAAAPKAVDEVAERKRAADRERMRMKRDRRATSRDSRDNGDICDPLSPEQRKVSPCTPSKETQPSIPVTPSTADAVSAAVLPDRNDFGLALEAYNAAAGRQGWPQAQKLTAPRQSSLRKRLLDAGGLGGWIAAMERAERSEFLTSSRNGWKPDLDFFLQAKSFTKLMEGSYDRTSSARSGQPTVQGATRSDPFYAELVAAVARRTGHLGPEVSQDPGPHGAQRYREGEGSRDAITLDLSPVSGPCGRDSEMLRDGPRLYAVAGAGRNFGGG